VYEWIALSAAICFAATYLITPYFMRFFSGIELWATDVQKRLRPVIPLSGGIPVLFGFLLGFFALVAADTFILRSQLDTKLLFAALLSMVLISFIGFFDDLNVRRQRMNISSDAVDFKVGLKQWQKPLLTLFAAIPLTVVGAGDSIVSLPFLGEINFGILFPLLVIPLAVVTVSNATNMLAGFNGLEAGLSAIALSTLGAYLSLLGRWEAAAIAFCVTASLLAFLRYNWIPARMFPGDSLTYLSGAAIVSVILLGNIERFSIIVFTPWIMEALLKLRGRFKVRSFGNLQPNDTLMAPYRKIYSLTHVAMKIPQWLNLRQGFNERQVVILLLAMQIIVSAIAFTFFT